MSRQRLCLSLVLALFCLDVIPAHADDLTVKAGDTDIGVEVHPAKGNLIFIWQANEVGLMDIDQRMMQQLARQGIETWSLDLLESYFLPNTTNNMDRVPAGAFAAVIQAAARTGRRVIVATSGRGAIPVLRGVRLWQLAHPGDGHLVGTILLSPKLFVETPDPGLPGKLMPIVRATNQSLVLMQPDKSPWYWKLNQSMAGLQAGGSDVYLWTLHGVRDRFYFRPDATGEETQAGDRLAAQLHTAVQLLLQQGDHPRLAVSNIETAPTPPVGKKEHELALYKGDPNPPRLRLPGLQGPIVDLRTLKGQVVLVNFWATWCPPCVHEMPSMQELARHFAGKPFTILGVNMAEDADTVHQFIQRRVHVTFPILLDKDGEALRAWHVFAFPTSYVVDKQGHIRFALFGGIDWNTPGVKRRLAALIAE